MYRRLLIEMTPYQIIRVTNNVCHNFVENKYVANSAGLEYISSPSPQNVGALTPALKFPLVYAHGPPALHRSKLK